MARAMYQGGFFTIMDEPTAALDPRSEEEIFDQMIGLTKDRTSLFISHNDLINSGGLYKSMYIAQAEQYS